MQPTDICSCGKPHRSPTKTVVIGANALAALPATCDAYRHILVVADRHTQAACGDRVVSLLGDRVAAVQVFNDEILIPDETALSAIEEPIRGRLKKGSCPIDHIVGVGSGVINDLCKETAHRFDLRYTIVATAPSMDGYASAGAALILGGMKVTLTATPPEAIVADTAVLCGAPMDMIRAGYGDIIGKYSCLNDWKLAALIRGEYICPAVWQWVKDTADRVRSMAVGIRRREPEAIEALMRALVDVGVAMAYVGNSRPASGSEHHIAHFLEISGIRRGRPYLAHGVDVACGAVLTARLREEILSRAPAPRPFDREAYAATIRDVYAVRGGTHGETHGEMPGDGMEASIVNMQESIGWYTDRGIERFVLSHTEEIRAVLADAPSAAETRAMVEAVGLSFESFLAFYGEDTLREAILWGKDLKDRYTVLWLYHRFYA